MLSPAFITTFQVGVIQPYQKFQSIIKDRFTPHPSITDEYDKSGTHYRDGPILSVISYFFRAFVGSQNDCWVRYE